MNLDALALWQALDTCKEHAAALREALEDMGTLSLPSIDLTDISRGDRRLLDQFAYRYTRLQDDIGARLMPSILRALGEEIRPMSFLDRLDRLEQLEWLHSAAEWTELRHIRNEFAHEYPQTPAERLARLEAALRAAERVLDTFDRLTGLAERRFTPRTH